MKCLYDMLELGLWFALGLGLGFQLGFRIFNQCFRALTSIIGVNKWVCHVINQVCLIRCESADRPSLLLSHGY